MPPTTDTIGSGPAVFSYLKARGRVGSHGFGSSSNILTLWYLFSPYIFLREKNPGDSLEKSSLCLVYIASHANIRRGSRAKEGVMNLVYDENAPPSSELSQEEIHSHIL